jgi:hypothetical protein
LANIYHCSIEIRKQLGISEQNVAHYAELAGQYTVYGLRNLKPHPATPRKLNLLTKAYEPLDQDNLAESALIAYLQKIKDYLERSFAELQNKTNIIVILKTLQTQ